MENVYKGDIDVFAEGYYNKLGILSGAGLRENSNVMQQFGQEVKSDLKDTSEEGPGIATSLAGPGDRFRWVINDAECKKVESLNAEATGCNRILEPATRLCQRCRSYRIFL